MITAIERRQGTVGGFTCMLLLVILVAQFYGSEALAQLPAAVPATSPPTRPTTPPTTTDGMNVSASLTIDAILDAALEHAPMARRPRNYQELADTHD
ncbi:MAG: hypothetical protein KJN90_11400, partial [Gammaproteobacteria bacterium]|nr:hypothetical protein [Gammaproteobacteria bacterium]